MNTSFTPGQWVASRVQSEYGTWGVFTKEGMYSVLDGSAPHGQAEANARLIASAPLLLDAAKQALTALTPWRNFEEQEANIALQVAINLATGQEP